MAIRFILGTGNNRNIFERAPLHTAKWDEQKQGLRQYLGCLLTVLESNLSSWRGWKIFRKIFPPRPLTKEEKRLELLALVRKVREEQGDYDVPAHSKARPKKAAAAKVDKGRRLHRPTRPL
jgi:hypothetical protein